MISVAELCSSRRNSKILFFLREPNRLMPSRCSSKFAFEDSLLFDFGVIPAQEIVHRKRITIFILLQFRISLLWEEPRCEIGLNRKLLVMSS